ELTEEEGPVQHLQKGQKQPDLLVCRMQAGYHSVLQANSEDCYKIGERYEYEHNRKGKPTGQLN
ncbi:MAG: hypothetical protein ACKOXI_00125, partial [Candidatus Planktophila sp.]